MRTSSLLVLVLVILSVFYGCKKDEGETSKFDTVHMAGEFYKQGKFECWMQFDGQADRPRYMWIGRPNNPCCKICRPEGVFGLNKRTNVVHIAKRDERNKDWFLKFGSFFEDAMKQAQKTDSIKIYTEKYAETTREVIVVHKTLPKRQQKYLVDPDTKLPIKFTTVRDDDPAELMRKTICVKHLAWIRYNETLPQVIFDVPPDARIVISEIDAMVYPEKGLLAEGLSPQQACVKLVSTITQAVIDKDFKTLNRYFLLPMPEDFFTNPPTPQKPVPLELLGHDEPYKHEDYWYVPVKLKLTNGEIQHTTPMLKFYKMDGKSYCFFVGTKENGLLD